jgi:alpha-amylase/alpha-mannosidase (GH57 family)
MERYVCIHGHFYQPPRENPWLEAIEVQDSAHPYHDWNERICAECYAPNTASRIVNGDGYILDIVNNYSKISFNFGPTLLVWLEERQPEIHAAVIEADRLSTERFSGHGSAMAQCYNHIIMPLANGRDKYTQVCWGVRDFQRRFRRDPEGMWLPETAVDLETLDIMAQMGIKFTILASRQARRIRPIDKAEGWQSVEGSRIDPTTNYLCILPSGRTIVLYFYDGPISQSLSFEGLLRSGEALSNRLTGAFNANGSRDEIVHIATDGETFGHHQKFGDMALAYALYHIESKGLARVTNYGEHLEHHAPRHVVEVYDNSSWSCVHGVERWRDNCGCSSGMHPGWHQRWRRPLREALDGLRDRCIPFFESEASQCLKDPWQARNDYIDVINDRSVENVESFLASHARRELGEEEKKRALMLLGMQRCGLLMYTSCGWFFDEISGLETNQIIKYASRMIQLAETLDPSLSLEPDFVKALEKAPSNLMGNGAAVYELHVKPARIDILRAVAHAVMSSSFVVDSASGLRHVYSYDLEQEAYERLEAGPRRLATGRITTRNRLTWETALISFAALSLGDTDVTVGLRGSESPEEYMEMREEMAGTFQKGGIPEIVRAMDKNFGRTQYTLRHLFADRQRELINEILKPKYDQIENVYLGIYQANYSLMDFLRSLGSPIPKTLSCAADASIDLALSHVFDSRYTVDRLRQLIDDARKWSSAIDTGRITLTAESWIDGQIMELHDNPEGPEAAATMEKIKETIEVMNAVPLDLHLWRSQNLYFQMRKQLLDGMAKKSEEGDDEAGRWVHAFRELAEPLRVRV